MCDDLDTHPTASMARYTSHTLTLNAKRLPELGRLPRLHGDHRCLFGVVSIRRHHRKTHSAAGSILALPHAILMLPFLEETGILGVIYMGPVWRHHRSTRSAAGQILVFAPCDPHGTLSQRKQACCGYNTSCYSFLEETGMLKRKLGHVTLS